MPVENPANIDRQNRRIEQQAQTDADLETVVPSTSPPRGTAWWWRIGAVILGVAVIVLAISRAF
jgi:hypothetical protein